MHFFFFKDWFQWVRTLECLALIVYFAAGVVGLHDNFLASFDPLSPFRPSHRVEVIVSLAGEISCPKLEIHKVAVPTRSNEENFQMDLSY